MLILQRHHKVNKSKRHKQPQVSMCMFVKEFVCIIIMWQLLESELEQLARDARALKKFKRGKISEEELDRQFLHT